MRIQLGCALLAVALLVGVSTSLAGAASGRIPARWKNCTVVNKRYPHGVGKVGEEQYEASIGTVHPSDGSLPEGQFFHVAGPSGDGWVIVAIHRLAGELGTLPRREADRTL